jgi:hypothetical protein
MPVLPGDTVVDKERIIGKSGGPSRDRCYDFKNIFADKILRKNWRFLLKTKLNFEKKMIITLVFKKTSIFSPKIGKNGRNL